MIRIYFMYDIEKIDVPLLALNHKQQHGPKPKYENRVYGKIEQNTFVHCD